MLRSKLCTAGCTNDSCSAMKFVEAWWEALVDRDILYMVRTKRKVFDPHGNRYPTSKEVLEMAADNADRTLFYFGVR